MCVVLGEAGGCEVCSASQGCRKSGTHKVKDAILQCLVSDQKPAAELRSRTWPPLMGPCL